MLKVKYLFEPIATKALIRGIHNYFLWERLYALLDRSLLKIN